MTGNVINQWGKYRIFNKSCGPIDYIWKKISLNYFLMTYKFTFPSGLKTKKIRKNMEDVFTQRLRFMGVEGVINMLIKRENIEIEEISVYKPRVLFL